MPRGRPAGIPKTGGRAKGVPNRPKPVVMSPDEEAQNRVMTIVTPSEVRTPKAVMMDAMLFLDRMAKDHFENRDYAPALRYLQASVQVAEKLAPYIHARLIAMQGDDGAKDKPSFVVRAPAVMPDSSAWQAAVGAAVAEIDAQSGQNATPMRSNEVAAVQVPHEPKPAPVASAVALAADPKTNRITVMPPGPRIVQPVGTQAWLDSIKKVG